MTRLDRQPTDVDRSSMLPTDRMEALVEKVLTNTDMLSDEDLIIKLQNLQSDGLTLANALKIIRDFPRQRLPHSGRQWFLDLTARVYAPPADLAPMPGHIIR